VNRSARLPVALVGAVAVFGLALSPASRAAGSCGYANGAPFSVSTGGAQFSEHLYSVFPAGVACSFALAWVVRLTKEPPGALQPDGQYVLQARPGWRCEGKALIASPHRPPTVSGDCRTTSSSTAVKGFDWQIGEEHISQ
jgi:hypothetical protein